MKRTIHLCVSAVFVPLGILTAGNILFILDHEDGEYRARKGISTFQGNGCTCKTGRNCIFEIVESPVNTRIGSKKALKHKITNCDERAEAGIQYGMMIKGNEYWVAYSIYFPKNSGNAICNQGSASTDQRELRHQKKMRYTCNPLTRGGRVLDKGPPASYMYITGTKFTYKLYPFEGTKNGVHTFGCKIFAWPAGHDQWFTFYFRFTMGSEEHPYQIWCNGKMVVDALAATWHPGALMNGAWKIGPYVGDPGKGSRLFYTDDFYMGTGYGNVDDFLADTPYGPEKKTSVRQDAKHAWYHAKPSISTCIGARAMPYAKKAGLSLVGIDGSIVTNPKRASFGVNSSSHAWTGTQPLIVLGFDSGNTKGHSPLP